MGKTFVTSSTAMAESVMANFEAASFHRFDQRRSSLLVDVRTQFALHHRIEERENLALLAANLKFNAAIGQIADPADHIKAFGDLANGPTKPDTLHIAFVENLKRDH